MPMDDMGGYTPQQSGSGPSLTAFNPTWRDRMAQMLMGDAKPSPEKARLVEGLMGSRGLGSTGMGVADLTPAGIPMQAQEAYRAGDDRMLAMALMPGPKTPGIKAFHGSQQAIDQFDRPAYFSPNKDYAARFGDNVYEATLSPKNPHYTNNQSFVESLRSFPERADELRKAGHDAVILSSETDRMAPIMGLGGMIEPQIYTLDPSIAAKAPAGIRAFHGSPNDFDKFDMSKIGTGEGGAGVWAWVVFC